MDHQLTLMAVHAHPDDEAITTGGVLARYAAEGFQTVLVTCTDGGCGDGPGGVKPSEPGHDPAAVVALRAVELKASAAVLAVGAVETLDYADSGMMGWPQNEAPGAFWGVPVEAAAARLGRLIERYQPDVIVTYDEIGFYGHPDHIQAHRVTTAAVRETGSSAKVYWTTAPRSMIARFGELADEAGPVEAGTTEAGTSEAEATPPEQGGVSPEEMGLPDDEITTWVDVREFAGQKYDSLACHASQSDNAFLLQLGQDRFAELLGVETFLRVDARARPGDREDDLFAGLRG